MKDVIDNTICKDALKQIINELLHMSVFSSPEQELAYRREIMSRISGIAGQALGRVAKPPKSGEASQGN